MLSLIRSFDARFCSRNLSPIQLQEQSGLSVSAGGRLVCGIDDPAPPLRMQIFLRRVGTSPLARSPFVRRIHRIQLIIQRRRFASPFAKVGETLFILLPSHVL